VPKSSRDDNNNKASDDLGLYQLVCPGDLAINKMKAWQGSVAISRHRGVVSPAYFIYEAKHGECSRYLHYLMRSPRYTTGYLSISKGIRINQWDLEPQYHSRLPVVLPPKDEQEVIATFLDRETAKIDALIAEQEKLLVLLAEKRQATISRAVTRGLDSNVATKDSKTSWLGPVPAHWKITRLKYVAAAIFDCPHETPVYDPDGDYLVIRTADVDRGVLDASRMFRLDAAQYEIRTRRSDLAAGDIVYGREGERWGHAALVPEPGRYCLGQRMMQIRPSRQIDPVFLMWQLNSVATYRQGELDTVGATSPHVNVGTIRNFQLALPPIEEQRGIADHLTTEAVRFDALQAEAEHAMKLLREHRTALISAAVTGQIDVRSGTNSQAELMPEACVA
jgi:type I restriction enzyme S subunit